MLRTVDALRVFVELRFVGFLSRDWRELYWAKRSGLLSQIDHKGTLS